MEDNAKPIENPDDNIEELKPSEVVVSNGFAEASKILKSGINLNEEGLFVEPTCEICNSSLRIEAEEVWERTRSIKEVKDFYVSKSVKPHSVSVIENHMVNCKARSVSEIQRKEYAHRLERMKSEGLSTLDQISFMTSILTENLFSINSIVASGTETQSDIRKTKSAETIKLVARLESLCKLRASILGEMLGDGDLIYLPTKDFIGVFNKAIVANQGNKEVQTVIKQLLDDLQNIGKSN